jgi:hypothetical protein
VEWGYISTFIAINAELHYVAITIAPNVNGCQRASKNIYTHKSIAVVTFHLKSKWCALDLLTTLSIYPVYRVQVLVGLRCNPLEYSGF